MTLLIVERKGDALTKSEKEAVNFYTKQRKVVFKPAWPDLLVYDNKLDQITFIEVKRLGDKLGDADNEEETSKEKTEF